MYLLISKKTREVSNVQPAGENPKSFNNSEDHEVCPQCPGKGSENESVAACKHYLCDRMLGTLLRNGAGSAAYFNHNGKTNDEKSKLNQFEYFEL